MTPADYKRAKGAGMLTIARLNESTVAIGCRCFDPVTGKELDPVVNQFNIEECRRQVKAATAGLELLQEFLADLEAAPVMKPLGG